MRNEMITSKATVLQTLKAGGYISRGIASGFWLNFGNAARRKRVSWKSAIRELVTDGTIVRTDDHTSRVGETWGVSCSTERFERIMQPLMEWLKQDRKEKGVPTDDGDYLGEQLDRVGRYIWDHWDD